ncbi:MAG: SDR family oxidoreductase [Sphingobium sp.]
MPDLSALIIGGTSGIGRACAEKLLSQTFSVTLVGRDRVRAQAVATEMGGSVGVFAADAVDDASVEHLFATIPPPDHVIVSLAGGSALGRFTDIGEEAFRRSLDTKLFAYLNVARHALRVLPRTGSLTFVTGVSGMRPAPGASCLAVANMAIGGLIGTLALEHAPLRVNGVAPGTTDTPAWSRMPDDIRAALFNDMASRTPLGRIATPQDVADVVASLVANSFLTGVIIPCDGGARLM